MFRPLILLMLVASLIRGAEPTVVFLGDSLTAGYGLEESLAYPAVIQAAQPTWKVINAGVSGDTSAGGLRRLAWILKAKPTVVFIALGANDGLRGLPVEQLSQNLQKIITQVRAAGAIPVLAGMRLPANYGEEYRTRFAALYEQVATATKTPLMPFLLESVAMKPELNQADSVHPNAAGQQLIATNVLAFLHAEFAATKKSTPAP
jgi:acyl-CoA thioesterase I